ncbi:hypothetical protein LK07_24005 [Streptomyces pluripotens]|uniref:Uncharacterized protein n=1 Tax=Streptomyces pluripotens TaxID=1355015 RepID=A0A221P2T3_9ACTN|nr:hypothetical protein LK06_022840 [Streptomyces pluripotens]ASN26569.1 hypothetical protein LK07_24005 [Streptomyces pluripotens]
MPASNTSTAARKYMRIIWSSEKIAAKISKIKGMAGPPKMLDDSPIAAAAMPSFAAASPPRDSLMIQLVYESPISVAIATVGMNMVLTSTSLTMPCRTLRICSPVPRSSYAILAPAITKHIAVRADDSHNTWFSNHKATSVAPF